MSLHILSAIKALFAKLENSSAVKTTESAIINAWDAGWTAFEASAPSDLLQLAATVLTGPSGRLVAE